MKSQDLATLEKEVSKNSEIYELFLHELKDIYWAEKRLVEKLPGLSEKATSEKLKEAIHSHTQETENHVNRLDNIFEILDEKAEGVTCEAMKGLLEESKDVMKKTDAHYLVRDAGIIITCQKVEHYEIASYGSLSHLAKIMDLKDSMKILEETLEEEKKRTPSCQRLQWKKSTLKL